MIGGLVLTPDSDIRMILPTQFDFLTSTLFETQRHVSLIVSNYSSRPVDALERRKSKSARR